MAEEYDKNPDVWSRYQKHAEHASTCLKKWREEAHEGFRFAAGDQWTDEQRSALTKQQKPALVFNQVHRVLSAVAGSEIINRFEPRYLRRTLEDQGVVDVVNAWVRYHRGECDAQHEESKAFMDALVCGVGVTETWIDDRDDPNGVVKTERVPVEDVMWDPGAIQQNLLDAGYVYRGRWVPVEDFARKFAGGDEIVSGYKDTQDTSRWRVGQPADQSRAWMYLEDPRDWVNCRRDEILLVDYQYRDETDAIVFTLPDGTLDFEYQERFEDTRQRILEGMGHDIAQGAEIEKKPCYYSCILAGDKVLSKTMLPYRGFTYKFITGFEDRTTQYPTYFGLMRLMKDPQDFANKFMSQLIHIIATNPKGGLVSGPNVFENEAQARADWAKPGGFIKTNKPNFKDDIMHLPQGQMPIAQLQMFQTVSEMVAGNAGVNMNYLGGQAEDLRRASGEAVQSIQKQATAPLAPLFDSFRRYRRSLGRMMLQFLKEHGEPNSVVRIAGPPLEQYAPLSMQAMYQRYDVEIDESPLTSSSPIELWKSLTEQGFLPQLLEAGLIPPQILPMLMPNLSQPMRDMWSQHINQMMQMQQAAPPPTEGETPV